MLKKSIFSVAMILTGFIAMAQSTDSTVAAATPPATTFSGSVDVYYRFNSLNKGDFNNKTSFTNSANAFELGMASIRADHSFGKVSATADLGFGRRAQEFSYADGIGWPLGTGNGFTSLASVKQLYLTYAPSDKIKFTAGKWATHIGWELLDAFSNRNYSMSYGFSYGPFSHTGLKADISLGGKSAFMIGVANATDLATITPTSSAVKVAIAQFSTGSSNDKFKAFINYQGGTGFSQLDVVLNAVITSQFGINYDGTIKSVKYDMDGSSTNKSWTSNAVYLNYDPVSNFGLTLRGEYFDDKKAVAGVGTSIFQTTLSGNIKSGALTIIPELRIDSGNDAIFTMGDGTASKSTFSAIIAAVYKF